ncbi:MAG: hypothetical protein PVJ67_05335 [Candidatus Pacearchaeota archaeon]|jgi:hypothetical protein
MKKIKNKKGELTTQQIVMLIILITSFAVILFFIFRLNLGEITDKEVCHNSVVMKSQSKLPSGSLDCKTSYVCISGGGECEGINPSETIKLEMETPKEEVMEKIADEMVDCWWMFGEGKVDYVGGINFKNNKACSICSIIAFDESMQENKELGGAISYSEFYNYLKKEKDGETYLSYLYNTDNPDDFGSSYLGNFFEFDKQYFVLTALGKKGTFSEAFSFTKPGIIIGIVNYFAEDDEEKELDSLPVIVLEKTTENYEKIGCDKYLTKA